MWSRQGTIDGIALPVLLGIFVAVSLLQVFIGGSLADIKNWFIPKCPKCQVVLEKSGFMGMKFPTRCPGCNLIISCGKQRSESGRWG
jgi:hypothetical protein